MWKYIKEYLHIAIIAGSFMIGEVLMDLLQPGLMRKIVDDGVLGLSAGGVGNMTLIWPLGIQMACLVIFGGLCGSLNNVFVHMTGQSIGNEIRKDAFRKIMAFSFPQVDQFGMGSLVTRVTNDVTQVQNYISQFVRGMIRTSILMFGSIFFMFRLNRQFGLIVLCAFPVLVGGMAFCLSRANPLLGRLQEQLDRINAIMEEDVSGIRMIKACVREGYEKLRFGKSNEALVRIQLQVLTIFAFMNPIINGIIYLAVAVILKVGDYQVHTGGATPGDVMAAITYTTQLLTGILGLSMLFQSISKGIVSWKRLKEILKSSPGLKDGSFEGQGEEKGQIEFRNVSFAYPGSTQTVLKDISFKINSGETLAIMGATGCGKSTLVHLIPRFYDATEGSVLVDGVNVKEFKQKALRDKIAIVLQKSELFSLSIKENIAWGKKEAGEAEIQRAAKAAQADDFICAGPDGYGTMIAERGMSLSGGQKQRISISRAVIKDAEILILDDSTSALDLKTEADLYTALREYSPDSTKIMIAQRIASVRRADRILVLDKGMIAACGTHEELMRNCNIYQAIYDSQMGEEGEQNG